MIVAVLLIRLTDDSEVQAMVFVHGLMHRWGLGVFRYLSRHCRGEPQPGL